jgi:adenine specific DNA methylase Mod
LANRARFDPFQSNFLYYGDNLKILKDHIPNDTIDLIYLDPPFNSKADYNILFKEATGEKSAAQIQAFSDSWHWDIPSLEAYEYLTSNKVNNNVSTVAEALYSLLST